MFGAHFLAPCLQVRSYRYLDGVEPLLSRLHRVGYEMHAMSNYPQWYLRWTFVSCDGVMRVRACCCVSLWVGGWLSVLACT